MLTYAKEKAEKIIIIKKRQKTKKEEKPKNPSRGRARSSLLPLQPTPDRAATERFGTATENIANKKKEEKKEENKKKNNDGGNRSLC